MSVAEMPQSNKQHAVPQNIMDVEFKLIGDLTLRQFSYLLVCGGGAYLAVVTELGIFKWPIVLFLILAGVGLAFVPVQERGLDEWLVNFFRAIYMPTLRIWKKEPQIPSAFVRENLAVVRQELITLAPTSSRRKLEEYLEYKSKNEKIDPLDIPEREYAQKVRDAYAAVSASHGDNMSSPSSYSGSGVSVMVEDTTVATAGEPPIPEFPGEYPQGNKNEPDASSTPSTTSSVPSTLPQITLSVSPDAMPTVSTATAISSNVVDNQPAQKPQPAFINTKARNYQLGPTSSLSPMTPDRHSGRRFTNLVPKRGELVLPIRGEHTIKTSDQLQVEEDINEKAAKLQLLLAQIRGGNSQISDKVQVNTQDEFAKTVVDEIEEKAEVANKEQTTPDTTSAPVVETAKTPELMPSTLPVDTQAELLAEKLKTENERISKQLVQLQESKQKSTDETQQRKSDDMILKLKTEQERTQADFEALQKQLLDLQNKLKEKEDENVSVSSDASVKPVFARIAPLTNKPNIPSGVVKLADGTMVQGMLLIIKNSKNEAVRAFKTNTLGQFVLTTPLQNGTYTVEVSSNNKQQSFDIISLEAKGEVIPPIEIVGKSA